MKRIMLCGEASFLSTGFSTYALEMLSRLHESGKYEVCEFACYSQHGDQRAAALPWKHFSVMPRPGEEEAYKANPLNEFGESKFEEACLEFRPHIVADIRDWWHLEYQERSPLRGYFHWAIMPTVDSMPQDEQWIATFLSADAVFAYSDWGLDLLKEQSHGLIKTVCSAPPGADLTSYEVKADKRGHKAAMGLSPDSLIVGTVMRNQRRKLYPEGLAEAFATFLEKAPADLAKNTFLYWHTAWPDVGWDIPRLLKEAGISHKVLFTYACRKCGAAYPSFFQDALACCKNCKQPAATFPNTHAGVSRKTLSEIMGLFDVYVQYANSEGFGMPMVEAAACGIPVIATDYSAMSDVVRKVKGMPIRPLFLLREPETHCKRAIPDPTDFVRQLTDFLLLPEPVRQQRGWQARKAVEEHYTWDQSIARWMAHFDEVEIRPDSETWCSPPRLHQMQTNVPQGLSNEEVFVRWGMTHVAGRPDLADSYMAMRLIRDLNWGATFGYGMGGQYYNEASTLGTRQRFADFNRDKALNIMAEICRKRNHWEALRAERCKA